jgi:hypothetical protein
LSKRSQGCVLKAASDSMHSGQVFTFDDTHQNFAGVLGVTSFGDIRLQETVLS